MATDTQKTDVTVSRNRTGGAPKGNMNRASHGLRAGRLPKGCGYIVRAVNDFTRSFNRALIAQKGEVSFTDAAAVNSATRWERHSCLALRWLRLHADEMSHDQRLAYSREIAKASSERDKCIRATGLDVCDVIAETSIYGAGFPVIELGTPDAEADATPTTTPPDASAAASVAHTADADGDSDGDGDGGDCGDVAATDATAANCGDATASGADGDTLPDLF